MRQHFRQTHHIVASNRSRAPRWFMASAAILAFTAMLGAAVSPAHAQFDRITVFGDSYADTGTAPGGAIRIIYSWGGCPTPYPGSVAEGLTNCHFTGGTNFADTLQAIYGVPTLTNYAIGGALTDNTNNLSGNPDLGFVGELNRFNGNRFTERDLVLLSIGGNDEGYMTVGDTIAQVNARATLAATHAQAGLEQLVTAGARNIIWFGAGNSIYFPQPPVNGLSPEQRNAWAHTYFLLNQQLAAPLARSGVRIFLFDYETLQARIAADPGQYGFVPGGCQGSPVTEAGIATCLAASWEEQNSFFYWNTVHPTSAGMALVARYMANQVDAPTTVVPQGRITTSLATNFTTSLLGHLDAGRTFQAYGLGDDVAFAHARDMKGTDADTREATSKWLSFGGVTYGNAGVERQFYAAGYDYHAVSGTIGVEYKASGNMRFGAQFGYSTPTIDLDVQNAQDRITTYQFAGYGSFAANNWFADALIAYGRQNYALDRDGIIDTIHGSTNADTLSVAGKAGYLVTIGPLRAGPIGGVNYTGGTIHAYIETGDSLITMMVDRQTLDNLTGDAGLQVRLPFQFGSGTYSPFVNVTVEHDFTGSIRTITTTQVTTPLLPVLTPVEDNGGTYGKVAAGVATMLDTSVSATMNAETTFGRDGGDDVVVSGGLRLTF